MQSVHNPQATPVALKDMDEQDSDNAESVGDGEELAYVGAGEGLLEGRRGSREMGTLVSVLGVESP